MKSMEENDRIIWDSGYGYDIGHFIGQGKMLGTYECDMATGVVQGKNSYPVSEVIPYSKTKISELTKKYGYEKSFSETF